jgi:hypothetical protein
MTLNTTEVTSDYNRGQAPLITGQYSIESNGRKWTINVQEMPLVTDATQRAADAVMSSVPCENPSREMVAPPETPHQVSTTQTTSTPLYRSQSAPIIETAGIAFGQLEDDDFKRPGSRNPLSRLDSIRGQRRGAVDDGDRNPVDRRASIDYYNDKRVN